MNYNDLRDWIDLLEREGELRRISAKVDWNEELAGIVRKVFDKRGPALLFENIKDHENTRGNKLFTGGLLTLTRLELMFGLPVKKGRPFRERMQEIVRICRQRFNERIKPSLVDTGAVKENIIIEGDVDLFEFPVPKWHQFDGGRYINTFCAVITRNPDTAVQNLGLYRGQILSKGKIGVLLVPSQDWGKHFMRYQELGQPMPVAVAYGFDPTLAFMAATPLSENICEYDVMGAIRQQPVDLVKCETSDLEVPANAEIVIEGTISTDPESFEMEGPFGEYTGYYGEQDKRPVIKVNCITHRNDPIFRGTLEGLAQGHPNEDSCIYTASVPALGLNALEHAGVPGIIDLSAGFIHAVKIHKTFRGQAQLIANVLWSMQAGSYFFKIVMVVDEDVDVHSNEALLEALYYRVNPLDGGLTIFPNCFGSILDPSFPFEERKELLHGSGKWHRILIDATRNWEWKKLKSWGDDVITPNCTVLSEEIERLIERRWNEYGID